MAKLEEWSAPSSDAILATYRITSGKLKACRGNESRPYTARARKTFDLWKAAQGFPDIETMLVKTDDAVSLTIRKGGIIVEGRKNLNVGLVRATTKNLQPVDVELDEVDRKDGPLKDRFRRLFLSILDRFNGTVLPRAYGFELGVAEGVVYVSDGQLQFAGDFASPTDFVQELFAAAEVDDVVKYTFLDTYDPPKGETFEMEDLIRRVAPPSDSKTIAFDKNGWLLDWDGEASLDVILRLSSLAAVAGKISLKDGPVSVTLLTDANVPNVVLNMIDKERIDLTLRYVNSTLISDT